MNIRISYSCFCAYVYIVASVIILRLTPLPYMYKSLLAQPALIAFPYLIGKPIVLVVKKLIIRAYGKQTPVIRIMEAWATGVIFIVVLEALLYVNYVFEANLFFLGMLPICLFSIFSPGDSQKYDQNREYEINRWTYLALILGVIFSALITMYWNYPYASDGDYLNHTYRTLMIVNRNRPILFYAYLPAMHTLYAALIILFNIKSLEGAFYLLWSSRFILCPLYALGVYILSNILFKDRDLSLIAVVVALSIITHSEASFCAWHTAPKNYIFILFVYALFAHNQLCGFLAREKNKRLLIRFLIHLWIVSVSLWLALYLIQLRLIGYQIAYILSLIHI